jgi:hypothetical protein
MLKYLSQSSTAVVAALFEAEADDYKVLPYRFQKIYMNPYRVFGLDENAPSISLARDAFRKNVLSFVGHFYGLANPKATLEQMVFAYHLIRGTLKGNISTKRFEFRLTSITQKN